MIFPRINRDKAEKAFGVYKNVSGGSVAIGNALCWDVSSPDGNRVSKPATATLSLFIGIAVETIADTEFGKLQLHGYCAAALCINNATQAFAAGDILVPTNAQFYLSWSAAGDGKTGFVYAGEAVTTTATTQITSANKKVFIRAL